MNQILIVEESRSEADDLQRELHLAGVVNPIRHITDGAEAMALLLKEERSAASTAVPSILFIDLKLPNLVGFEILDRIRSRDAFLRTLRIALTQLEDIASIRHAYALGAQTFLTQPVWHEDLAAVIRSFPRHWMFSGGPEGTAYPSATI